MSTYKLDKRGNARTPGYRFTVYSKQDADLLALKENLRRHNILARDYIRSVYKSWGEHPKHGYGMKIERVKLMGRGPRTKPAMQDYGFPRAYDQNLPHKHATHWDVYQGEDTYAMANLMYELENNLTPGQHALIMKERNKLWDAESKMLGVLGAAGIKRVGTRHGTYFQGIE